MSPRLKALRLLTLAGLAIIAGTWLWMADGGEAPTAAANETDPPAIATAMASAGNETPTGTPRAFLGVPMPAPELPLRDAVPSLQGRADAGDPLAACRLGVALLRCQGIDLFPGHDAVYAVEEKSRAAKGDIDSANALAAIRLRRTRIREACAGIPAELVAQAGHYVRKAALAGEPEAMVRYAAGETLTTRDPWNGFIATPEFDAWRREARPTLERALDDGVPEAALLLAQAHAAADGGLLAMLLPRDPVEARASLVLANRLFGEHPALSQLVDRTSLDSEQTALAEARAADWHETRFQGRRVALADSTSALLPLKVWFVDTDEPAGWPGTQPSVDCQAPGGVAP